MNTRKTFCTVNANMVMLDKVIKDLERFSAEAQVAGYTNLVTEIENGKIYIIGDKA